MIAFIQDDHGLVKKADDFARRAHFGQTRKGAKCEPYVRHAEQVAKLVKQAGGDPVDIASALLHDVPEDTGFSTQDIGRLFPDRVTGTVYWLTNPDYFSGLDPLEKKRQQSIRLGLGPENVKLIRLAEVTSNLKSLANDPPVNWSSKRKFD